MSLIWACGFLFGESSRNRSTGGSGLGLYLVNMILERHGAACAVENTEDGVKAEAVFPQNSLPTETL